MNSVVAIVVTYNRKQLLRENIEALLNQGKYSIDILIIDNASNDGTEEMVRAILSERIIYINTHKNLGGAGGFSIGVKEACERGYEYGWIMDDDSIPEPDAVTPLIEFTREHDFSFLASTVFWTDGKLHHMNRPTQELIDDESIAIARENCAVAIKDCSFVGCFINLRHVYQVGLPISEFFIYGDDVEYTRRLRKSGPAYWLLQSTIIHKSPENKGADIVECPKERIDRFYFQARNGVYISKKNYDARRRLRYHAKKLKTLYRIVTKAKNAKLKRCLTVMNGWIAGIWFDPKIQFPRQG